MKTYTKIDFIEYRVRFEKNNTKSTVNAELLTELLTQKKLPPKWAGLCAEPFDKFFSLGYVNKRSSTSKSSTPNVCHVRLNYNHSTRKKKIYFHGLEIVLINDYYYILCFAQSSYYKRSTGATDVIYKVKEYQIKEILDKVFEYVEP